VRLLTWNIHKGIGGLDRRHDLARIEEVLAHHDADVVLLQEVDEGVPRSRREPQAALLAERLGYGHWVFGPNVRLKSGRYGNATLSRHPIGEWDNVDLTFPLKKPRGGLHTELRVDVDGHRRVLHVVNIHLGLAGLERRWQVGRLLDVLGREHVNARSRVIIAGDTNDWTGALPGGALGRADFECVTGRRRRALLTFPAWRPVGALDRVFVRGPLLAERGQRSRLQMSKRASDHLPVVVDLELV